MLGILTLAACQPEDTNATLEVGELIIKKSDGGQEAFQVEIADTPQKLSQGLMFRESMEADTGMLFIMPATGFQSFWMKNTLIPLDMLFINNQGVLGHIHHNAIPNDLTMIPSQVPTKYILEINGGQASARGIEVGDQVFHKKIKRTLAE